MSNFRGTFATFAHKRGGTFPAWCCAGLAALSALGCSPRKEKPKSKSSSLSIIGTSDLHGHLETLPAFAGYLDIIRNTQGGVVLVDAGDMFQGTLESNSVEGTSIVDAYNDLGYSAVAIGNHEFDFGPVGPVTLAGPKDDPRGALKALAKRANFPFLAANMVEEGTLLNAPNIQPSALVDIGGTKVGIIGGSTMSTPFTTLSANVRGIEMVPLADAITTQAKNLRSEGAVVVVAAIHAGGQCQKFENPKDLSSCKVGEIGDVASALAPGLVDVIVAGHTHQGMAHEIGGIPVIQSYANGRAFGRVDFTLKGGHVSDAHIFPPQDVCVVVGVKGCPAYQGRATTADATLAKSVEKARKASDAVAKRPLGIVVKDRLRRSHGEESAVGNLFVDLMLAARPEADVAITNGGGLRADIMPGEMRYEDLFRANPFDNQFAFLKVSVGALKKLLSQLLVRDTALLSLAGIAVRGTCKDGKLELTLMSKAKVLKDSKVLDVVTSDFLASGQFKKLNLPGTEIKFEQGEAIRDAMATALTKRGGTLSSGDLLSKKSPRYTLPQKPPVRCKDIQ